MVLASFDGLIFEDLHATSSTWSLPSRKWPDPSMTSYLYTSSWTWTDAFCIRTYDQWLMERRSLVKIGQNTSLARHELYICTIPLELASSLPEFSTSLVRINSTSRRFAWSTCPRKVRTDIEENKYWKWRGNILLYCIKRKQILILVLNCYSLLSILVILNQQ
jgi:hypothetical protein